MNDLYSLWSAGWVDFGLLVVTIVQGALALFYLGAARFERTTGPVDRIRDLTNTLNEFARARPAARTARLK